MCSSSTTGTAYCTSSWLPIVLLADRVRTPGESTLVRSLKAGGDTSRLRAGAAPADEGSSRDCLLVRVQGPTYTNLNAKLGPLLPPWSPGTCVRALGTGPYLSIGEELPDDPRPAGVPCQLIVVRWSDLAQPVKA